MGTKVESSSDGGGSITIVKTTDLIQYAVDLLQNLYTRFQMGTLNQWLNPLHRMPMVPDYQFLSTGIEQNRLRKSASVRSVT